MTKVLTFVMAGGKGERLFPLTRERTKPAVPFGGTYRIIDFTLSNCINSGLRNICVFTQYKSSSLHHHLIMGWNILNSELGEYIDAIPAQQRIGESWYSGTADSIYQNLYLAKEERPDYVLILSGDHVYTMDYSEIIEYHRQQQAELTVAVIETPKEGSQRLGILDVDRKMKIKGFHEKPTKAIPFFGQPNLACASMGVYVFNRQTLIDELEEDAKLKNSEHDFGKNIIPQMLSKKRKIFAFNFKDPQTKQANYWRDVGDIDAYYEANMDLVKVVPEFNLYDRSWPIRTYEGQFPPSKTVWGGEEDKSRIGRAINSLISNGCIISGGLVRYSLLSPSVRINSFAEVQNSIIMHGTEVGRHSKIRRSIIDKNVSISPRTKIGYDLDEDRKRFTVTDSGIVVVPKDTVV
ncbi:glucose-1-phosphate adenylyltransferase [Candidatus Omnitrophota bacterium]